MRTPSNRTIAAVRSTVNEYLNSAGSAVIRQRTQVSDGAGGWSFGTTIHGTVPAWILPMGAPNQIQVAGGAVSEKVAYTLICGTAVPLALNYEVVFGGSTYEVRAIEHAADVQHQAFQRAVVERIV